MRARLFFAVALLSLAACTNDATDPDVVAGEDALTSIRTVHSGAVDLLGSYRYRALYVVDTAASRELRSVALTGGERTLATLPTGEPISASESADGGTFLVRHGDAIGIADLRASTPTWTEVAPAARRAELRGATVLWSTGTASPFESNLFVRAPDGAVRQAPGTFYVDSYELSADGKKVAYWSNRVLTSFDVQTGAAVSTPAEYGTFHFVGDALLFAKESAGELWRLDASGAKRFYSAPVASSDFEWFVRPDGKLLAATHWDLQRPEWTHLELVDPSTGEGTDYAAAPGAAAPHYQHWRYVESADRRFLVDWYPSAANTNVGSVWLHDLGASPNVASKKILDGVTVGWMKNGSAGFSGGYSLAGRCRFVGGAFLRCTKNDVDTSPVVVGLDPARPATCSVSPSLVSCTSADGSTAGTTATRARGVGDDAWFGGRFAFEERAGDVQRLSLLDPKTGGRETVVDRTCREGSFRVSTTAQRLFVSDCTGLHIAR